MHKRFLPSIVLSCLCIGCGTGEYESRIGQHRASSKPDALSPAEELPGTRVSIRMPRCFTALVEGAVDPKRAGSPPFPIPGVHRTYEAFVKDSEGGDIPFYCHVLVMETPKIPGQNVASQFQAGPGGKPPPGAPQLTDVLATSPEGKESKWQMLHMPSPVPQEFYYKDKTGKETYRSMPFIAEMYVHEEAGFSIVLAWRVPSSIEQNIGDVGLAELAKLTAGGVSVKPQ